MRGNLRYFLAVIWLCSFAKAQAQLPGFTPEQQVKRPEAATLDNITVEVETTAVAMERKVRVSFLLNQKPSSYFSYFQKKPNRLIFDFFDTKPGPDQIYVIPDPPFLSCQIESFKVDMNKEIAGLTPDIRDQTRVTLVSQYEINYQVDSHEGKVVLTYNWSLDKKKQMQYIVKKKSHWKLYTLASLLGGGGLMAYALWPQPIDSGSQPLSGNPVSHPAVPGQ